MGGPGGMGGAGGMGGMGGGMGGPGGMGAAGNFNTMSSVNSTASSMGGAPGGMGMGGGMVGPGGMGMQRPPPLLKKEPIKITLTGKERGFYSNMYTMASKGNENVSGKDAVMFFSKSGLPMDKMKGIWNISARTSITHVSKDEFYLALRLIAYH